MRTASVAAGAALLLLLFAIPACALTLADATWQEMLGLADCVVAARVSTIVPEASQSPGDHGVRTRMRLTQVRVVSGHGQESTVDVLLPGGSLDGKTVRVPGAPRFAEGESVVLFLRRSDDGGAEFYLCGHGLGVLRVRGENVVPDLPVSGGPPASGEDAVVFETRFTPAPEALQNRIENANVAEDFHSSSSSSSPWVYFGFAAVAALIAVVLRRRMRTLAIALALCSTVALAALFYRPAVAAVPAGGFTYVLEGPKWDLTSPTLDRVEGGRILWYQGGGTKDLSDSDSFDVIRAAFQKWEDVPDSAVAFRQAGLSIDRGSFADGHNTISFLKKPPRPTFDAKTLAVTYLINDGADQFFTDTDTVFNDRDITWVTTGQRYSLDVVALHEIGHFIGMAHSTNVADVMYPVAQGIHDLSPSDAAGAAALYPLAAYAPMALASGSPTAGAAPLTVAFSSELSNPGPSKPLIVQWDFGDGSPVSSDLNPQHVYAAAGNFTATLTIPGSIAQPAAVPVQVVSNALQPQVVSFQFNATLNDLGAGKDKLSMVIGGVHFLAGDTLNISIGALDLGATPVSNADPGVVTLDSTLAFAGHGSFGGVIAVIYTAKKSQLSVRLTGAQLGRRVDFRDPSNTAQTGTISLPLRIVDTHAGALTVYATNLTFQYQLKNSGLLERSIVGKMSSPLKAVRP